MPRLVGVLMSVAVLGSPAGARQTPPAHAAEVRLAIEGHANATPWVAAKDDFVAVAWGATSPSGSSDVYLAVSRDRGRSFAAPVRVNAQAGTARLGGELPPRVALGPTAASGDPPMTVVWGAKLATTVILAAQSVDGGRTFGQQQVLSTQNAAGDRGWHALAIDPRGTAHVMWLDHRGLAARPKPGHDHHGDGTEMARLSGLYYSAMMSQAGQQVGGSAGREAKPHLPTCPPGRPCPEEREVAKGVCYCCKLAMAASPGHELYVAWRHVYPGNIRDIAFAKSSDEGRTFGQPIRVSEDNWQLAGCPDDGPAMAIGRDGTIHVVWPTVIGGETPQGSLFYASSRDGRGFTPRRQIPTRGSPRPMHPQIVADPSGRLLVAWDEVIDGVRQASVRALTFDPAGKLTVGPLIGLGDAPSAYPVVAMTARGPIAAWTQGTGAGSQIVVRVLF